MPRRMDKTEWIPTEVFFHQGVHIDMEKNTVTAGDGRMWVDVVLGPPEVIEQIIAGEPHAPLEAWGVRVQN